MHTTMRDVFFIFEDVVFREREGVMSFCMDGHVSHTAGEIRAERERDRVCERRSIERCERGARDAGAD